MNSVQVTYRIAHEIHRGVVGDVFFFYHGKQDVFWITKQVKLPGGQWERCNYFNKRVPESNIQIFPRCTVKLERMPGFPQTSPNPTLPFFLSFFCFLSF